MPVLQPSHEISPRVDVLTRLPPRQFEQSQARLRASNVVLCISERRDEWNVEAAEEAHQRLRDQRVAPDSVRDDADAPVGAANLRGQKQIRDAFRSGVNVDIRRHDRNDNRVGTTSHFGQFLGVERGRGIDDQRRAITRHSELPASSHGHGSLETCDSVDGGILLWPFPIPTHARRLWVEIHQRRTMTRDREIGCQIGCERGLAGTALGIQYDDSFHALKNCQTDYVNNLLYRMTGVSNDSRLLRGWSRQ